MPRHSIAFAHPIASGCAEFADVENSLWTATPAGDIVTIRLLDARVTVRGGGYSQPVAVLPAPDGLSVLIVEGAGRVLTASRESAGRSEAAVLAELDGELVAARDDPDGNAILVLEAGQDARLLRVDLTDGTSEPIGDALAHPAALAVDPSSRQAVILERPATGPRLVAIHLDTGVQTIVGAAPGATALLHAPAGAGSAIVVASGATGTTALRGLAGAPDLAGPVVGGEVRALARWGSLILAITPGSIEAIEWGLPDGPVPIAVPIGPAFVRGWLTAEINPVAAGIAPADVELVVDEGPLAATISAGIEPPAPSGGRRVRVLTGPIPGEYHLTARRISDGSRLGQARFRITRHWPDRYLGPPVAITGKAQHFMMWGGGPNAPQNFGNHKAPEEWRVGVVLLSTSDKRLPADLTAMKKTWEDRLVNAAVSARTYYEEVSFRNTAFAAGGPLGTTISLTTPIFSLDLEKGWGDYFEQPTGKGNWYGWKPQATAWNAIAGEFCDMLDRTGQGNVLDKMDAVLFVMQTASEHLSVVGSKLALPKYVWPQALKAEYYHKKQHPGGPTTWTFAEKRTMFMPSHTPSSMPATQKMQSVSHTNILCHELGHTLGCGDLYNNGDFTGEVAARAVGSLDLMGNDSALPQFSLPHRMRLGWIGGTWIQRFNFSVDATPKNVTLQALETLARTGPPPGRVAGIEIQVRDGWNYYFEYRRLQPGQVGDQGLTSVSAGGQLVLGTDVIVLGNTGMMAGGDGDVRRPRILRLPPDADGDGPVLDALTEDYEETDFTNPDAAHDFRLRFDGADPADPNAARVRVEYVASRRADLRIRPARGEGDWKSPDIDLEGPKGMNTVATGLDHTIVVRVRNAGTEGARSVRVRVSWLPFTTTPGSWTKLPDPPLQDIPKGQTVEFRVPWKPQAVTVGGVVAQHFCVKAEVDRYVDPTDPTHSEIVVGNNWAQSNFDTTEVAHGSPSERRATGFMVTNRLPREATYLTAVDQDSELCRIYIGHAWIRLAPGADAHVPLDYESLAGDPIYGAMFEQQFETLARRSPPMLSLTSLLVPGAEDDWAGAGVVWGANLSIRLGRRTRVRIEGLFERTVRGVVMSTRDDKEEPVSRGRVNVVLWLAERPEAQLLCGDDVNATGRFDAVVPREIYDAAEGGRPIFAEALYLGEWPWVASRSGTRRLR